MARRPAIITQAEVARAVRAAKREGATAVELRPDGTLLIRLTPISTEPAETPIEAHSEIVL